ncbi:hypothetical protein GP486_007078, partial [Trichoglossum hirsutum]
MASAKKRDRGANFLDLGVAGRRTGVTLKDTGVRDEHGLEPIEGIFSSPAKSPGKSPARSNGPARNSTITTEEEMEIGNSTVPEPTDVLSERRRTIVPPPRARSPIKTFLNTPAKRVSSAGPISSPVQRLDKVGAAAAAVNRKLDFSTKPSQATGEATLESPSSLGIVEEAKESDSGLDAESTTRGDGGEDGNDSYRFMQQIGAQGAAEEDDAHEGYGDAAAGEDMDDVLPLVQDDDTIDFVGQDAAEPQRTYTSSSSAAATPVPTPKRGPGRPRRTEPNAPTPTATATKRGRGRPPREYREVVKEEETSEYDDARPPKRRRDSRSAEVAPPASKKRATATTTKKTKKPPPSQRDPKARITSGKRTSGVSNAMRTTSENQVSEPPDLEAKKRGRPRKDPQNPALKPRSLFITRRETPTEDGALRTRSGRTSVKPCAYWRNERIVYGEGDSREGEGYLLPTIKEVIRTEEVEPLKRTRRRIANAGKKRRRHTEESESEDDELEAWEVDPGIMTGEVEQWDEELERTGNLPPIPTGEYLKFSKIF